MKVAPTLDGRLRIDLESTMDRTVLAAIVVDACGATHWSALDHATEAMNPEHRADAGWDDFVMPDLGKSFAGQLEVIRQALENLGDEDPLFIAADDGEAWFGGLNQARLALEATHALSSADPEILEAGQRSAWFRSQFYMRLQGLILQFLMPI